jgi:hypothetical protein
MTTPFSLIKYEPPVEITQKLDAYQKAKSAERSNNSKPSSEGTNHQNKISLI